MRSHRTQNVRGQAAVEFAFVIIILSLILMGIFDLGRIIYTTAALSNAAREGARVAAVTADTTAIDNAVISKGIGLGIQASQISVTYPTSRSLGATVQVSISNYPFTTITPLIGRLFGPSNTMNLSSSSNMTIENP
jgi:Flp pilus assembly protein TadG